MAQFKGIDVIMGAIVIIIGFVLLPVMAWFLAVAKANDSLAAVAGLGALLDLILYGFCFGLVGIGISMIYIGYKKH